MASRNFVNEKCTVTYTCQIKDGASNLALASISTATLTLYSLDSSTLAVINSRDAQNVKNTNNVTISSSGLLTWAVQPNDTIIANTTLSIERHRALFTITTTDTPAKIGRWEADFYVRALNKVS